VSRSRTPEGEGHARQEGCGAAGPASIDAQVLAKKKVKDYGFNITAQHVLRHPACLVPPGLCWANPVMPSMCNSRTYAGPPSSPGTCNAQHFPDTPGPCTGP
jgi:hypothetical protein